MMSYFLAVNLRCPDFKKPTQKQARKPCNHTCINKAVYPLLHEGMNDGVCVWVHACVYV